MKSKNVNLKSIILIVAFLLTVFSCNKYETIEGSNSIVHGIENKVDGNYEFEISSNPSNASAAIRFSSVRSIMSYYAPLLLTTIPIERDYRHIHNTLVPSEITNQVVLTQMFSDVKAYIEQRYPQLGPADVIDVNDPECAIFVIAFAALEENGSLYTSGSKDMINRIPT